MSRFNIRRFLRLCTPKWHPVSGNTFRCTERRGGHQKSPDQGSVTSCASYLQPRRCLEFTQRSSGTTSRWLPSKLTLALTVNLMPVLLPSDLIRWVRLNSITILWAKIQAAGWHVSEAFSDCVLIILDRLKGWGKSSVNQQLLGFSDTALWLPFYFLAVNLTKYFEMKILIHH